MDQREKIAMTCFAVSAVMSQIDAQRLRQKYNELVIKHNEKVTVISYLVHILNREHVELNEFDLIALHPYVSIKENSCE